MTHISRGCLAQEVQSTFLVPSSLIGRGEKQVLSKSASGCLCLVATSLQCLQRSLAALHHYLVTQKYYIQLWVSIDAQWVFLTSWPPDFYRYILSFLFNLLSVKCNVTDFITLEHKKPDLTECDWLEVCHSDVSTFWDQREIILSKTKGVGGKRLLFLLWVWFKNKQTKKLVLVLMTTAE